jgi:predicted DNA-binding transcriptional regulator AlpA
MNEQPHPNADEILDDKALRTRYLLSSTTTWRMRKRKENPLPHFFVGGQVRYRLSEVKRFFEGEEK